MPEYTNYSDGFASGFTSEGRVNPDHLFDDFNVTRKGTIASGQGVLPRGTALGRITASGKWVKSLSASSDGSQVIRAVLLQEVDATSADAEGIMGRRGSVNPGAMTFGTGHTAASAEDACLDRGIVFERVIGG